MSLSSLQNYVKNLVPKGKENSNLLLLEATASPSLLEHLFLNLLSFYSLLAAALLVPSSWRAGFSCMFVLFLFTAGTWSAAGTVEPGGLVWTANDGVCLLIMTETGAGQLISGYMGKPESEPEKTRTRNVGFCMVRVLFRVQVSKTRNFKSPNYPTRNFGLARMPGLSSIHRSGHACRVYQPVEKPH